MNVPRMSILWLGFKLLAANGTFVFCFWAMLGSLGITPPLLEQTSENDAGYAMILTIGMGLCAVFLTYWELQDLKTDRQRRAMAQPPSMTLNTWLLQWLKVTEDDFRQNEAGNITEAQRVRVKAARENSRVSAIWQVTALLILSIIYYGVTVTLFRNSSADSTRSELALFVLWFAPGIISAFIYGFNPIILLRSFVPPPAPQLQSIDGTARVKWIPYLIKVGYVEIDGTRLYLPFEELSLFYSGARYTLHYVIDGGRVVLLSGRAHE